ncbi:MAG TPA: ATP-binding protein [Hanamia sp.]|nr:ATP-binding protein [Hanamia sp.]
MEHQETEIIIAIVAASVLFVLFAGFIITFLFFYNKKKRLHYQQLEAQQKLFEKEAFRSEMEVREQTLRYIAQEIHDNVGQVMLLAKLNLNKILMASPDKAIEETRDIIGEAINDLRNLSRSMNSDKVASLDLNNAIEKELQRLEKTGLVETSFITEGEIIEIDSAKKLILFRMIQEIMQNMIKHSKCRKVTLHLNYQKEILILNIEDNGRGFDVDDQLKKHNDEKGSGLLNLQNRAAALNAQLTIQSHPGEGTNIHIKMPL